MRQLQTELAEARGESHIGMSMQEVKERQTMVRRARELRKEKQREFESEKASGS